MADHRGGWCKSGNRNSWIIPDTYNRESNTSLINRLLMVTGSWLKAHGSCLKARGSRLMAKKNLALGPQAPLPWRRTFLGHEPWALNHEPRGMGHEPWAVNHAPLTINNRLNIYSSISTFQISRNTWNAHFNNLRFLLFPQSIWLKWFGNVLYFSKLSKVKRNGRRGHGHFPKY